MGGTRRGCAPPGARCGEAVRGPERQVLPGPGPSIERQAGVGRHGVAHQQNADPAERLAAHVGHGSLQDPASRIKRHRVC